jgi:NADH-quinone oxidoreductase subunit B
MSMAQAGDFMELLGTGPPAASSRSADLLIVAGSVTRRLVPLIRGVYARMLEPRWVIAWGACAISGGAYDNYATISGLSQIVPVDLVVHGCPPTPEALREALGLLHSGAVRDPSRRSSESTDWPIQRAPRSPSEGG